MSNCIYRKNRGTLWKATNEEARSKKKHVVLYKELATVVRPKTSESQQQKNLCRRTERENFRSEGDRVLSCVRIHSPPYRRSKATENVFYVTILLLQMADSCSDSSQNVYINKLKIHLLWQNARESAKRTIKTTVTSLSEKKTLAVQLVLDAMNPSEFANAYMSRSWHTANFMGKVVHFV